MTTFSRALLRRSALKTLVVFDLDGTLAKSKSHIDKEMGKILGDLLRSRRVAVISGGRLEQFESQLLHGLKVPSELLARLFLFPTTSTAFYRFGRGAWRRVYAERLSRAEKKKVMDAFARAFRATNYIHPKKIYGTLIEDRGTQITFSALGQDIVRVLGERGIREKEAWDKMNWRPKLIRVMKPLLRGFEVRSGGLTSIDVTRKGIDKAYGIRQIRAHLGVPIRDMVFVGDRIFPGGNDYAAKKTGVLCVQVGGPEDTKKFLKGLLRVAR